MVMTQKKKIYAINIVLLLMYCTCTLVLITNNNIELSLQFSETHWPPPITTSGNCGMLWRKENQIPMNEKIFNEMLWNDLGIHQMWNGKPQISHYIFNKIPQGTFTYWLAHIESQYRIEDKAYFADKYMMKQYIIDYKKQYPSFDAINHINHAQIIYDFNDTFPSITKLKELKETYKAFVVKPNHYSGKQIVINSNDNVTSETGRIIIKKSKHWLQRKYKNKANRINFESWYELIKPRVFIEENLNID
eukprot:41357_1